jgi:hypothetical protein
MLHIDKKYLMMLLLAFVIVVNGGGVAHGTLITLDAVADAGLYPGQSPYLRFVENSSSKPVLYDAASDPGFLAGNPIRWTSSQNVYDFADNPAIHNWDTDWLLVSAGDYWSPGSIVGASLTNLHAGTYRIAALSGSFTYDSFGWSPYAGQWRWGMNVRVHDGVVNGQATDYDTTLGSFDPLQLATDLNRYLSVTLADGGSLGFWIDDWNSLDNAGSLTFSVSKVPEPSTWLLLGLGLALLLQRRRTA